MDLAKIKRNVSKMVSMGAPEADIDAYISGEGATVEDIRSFTASKPSAIADSAQQFGENFNRGLYSAVNAPTSIANAAMGAMGLDYQFKRPLEVIAPSFDQEIMETPEAMTAAGRVTGTVGEYVGANALPAAGLIAKAPAIAQATAGATGIMGQSVNRVAQGVANAPAAAAVGELGASIGAGLGAQAARDISPDDPQAEFLGATLGGIGAPFLAAASPTRLAVKGANAVKQRFSPAAMEKQQREQIKKGIQDYMTPEAEARIQETADIQNSISGYNPSVAEATESPSFIATQRQFEGGLSGNELDSAISRYGQNEKAIRNAVSDQAPQSAQTADDVFAGARRRVNSAEERIDSSLQGLDSSAIKQADEIPSGTTRRDQGANIRDELIANKLDMKSDMSSLAEGMGLNDTTPKYRFDGPIKQQLAEAVTPNSALSDKAALPNAIVSDIRAMGDQVSLNDLMALRSRITDDIRANKSRPDGKRKAQHLEALKNRLDVVSDTIIRQSGDDALADGWKDFRTQYRENLIEPFEQGSAGRVLKTDLGGAYRIADENVAKEFFDGWNQTAAAQFNKIFGETSGANVAMETVALDDLHAFAVRSGVLDSSLISSWLRRKSGVLDSFPNIRDRVNDLEKATISISKRRSQLLERKRKVEQSYLAREIARLDSPVAGLSAEATIDNAIKNPARINKLMASIKNPESKNAISRHVWDTVLNSSKPIDFIDSNREAISKALGKNFKPALKIARAIEKNGIVPRPSGQAIDTNPVADVENILGSGLNQISSRVFAVKSGRTSARYAFADIAGRAFRNMSGNAAREMLRQAIYDPRISHDIANAIGNSKLSQPAAKRLYTFVISNGLVSEQKNSAD